MGTEKMTAEELRLRLARDGFVRIPCVLSPNALETLRSAWQRSADMARRGEWPYVRTLPKQFPPWNSDVSQGIWGVQHLLHPHLPDRDTFAASYFAPYIIDPVTALLECKPDDLVMELYNLLIRPERDFALRWHRDDIPPDISPDEEEARLKTPILHTQWNLSLYDDQSLIVVPASHLRARSEVERSADPFEDNLPGQLAVKMNAGDVVFYNNNILHRGVYTAKSERMTLHGSMGIGGADPARARNVLQHGIGDWVDQCDFSDLSHSAGQKGLSEMAEGFKRRLITIGRNDAGYSQSDD